MIQLQILRYISTPARFPITTSSKVSAKELIKTKEIKQTKPSYFHMYNALISYKKALNIKYSN